MSSNLESLSAKSSLTLTCPAPAKLNLFLHITGQRADGYHCLQTVFQLVDWHDSLRFTRRDDGLITRCKGPYNVPQESDLSVRAAHLLQAHTGCSKGVEIEIDKSLPMGAGLGGGSSDAATTLLALNRLWELHLSRDDLQRLAQPLGADVPFFIFGRNAFAQGIGEELCAVDLPTRYFLILTPPIHVSSAEIFASQELTRKTKNVKIADFIAQRSLSARWPDEFGQNDMQSVVLQKYPEIARVFAKLCSITPARMTGSGSSLFAAFSSKEAAVAAQALAPPGCSSVVASSLAFHPLFDFAL